MTRILFKFIIHPSYERPVKHGMVKSTIFGKSSLNLSFGQGSYLISDFASPNPVTAVLPQISLRSEIVIFNNNFVFCLAGFLKSFMISFCSMPWIAGWFPLREIIKRTSVFYPLLLKKYKKKLDKHLWRGLLCERCVIEIWRKCWLKYEKINILRKIWRKSKNMR